MNAEKRSDMKLQDLPFDCLYYIFRYLSVKDKLNFRKVSSNWIDSDSFIWQISDFAIKHSIYIETGRGGWMEREYIPKRILKLKEFKEIMINFGPILKQFCIFVTTSTEMSNAVYVFDGISHQMEGSFNYKAAMNIVVKNCHNLKKLEIRVDDDCANLTAICHALFLANQELVDVKLVFEDTAGQADLKNVINLGDAPGPVKRLCLESNDGSPEAVNLICELLKSRKVNLKELRLMYLEGDSILPLMQAIANYARDIQVLCLRVQDRDCHDSEVLLAMQELFVLKNLEHFSIHLGSAHIGDEVYSMIARNCSKLKKVELGGRNAVTDEGLRTLMTDLPNLISLTLSYVGVHSVVYSNVQYSLKSLKIESSNLSEDALKKISLLINLEELYISSYINCTDDVIKEITFGCKKLKKVTLEGGKNITGNGINALVTGIPNLESVVLQDLDIDLSVQSNAQSKIRSLKIIYSDDNDNDNFKRVGIFKNLKELRLDDVNITNETLSSISSGCKQLVKFTLYDVSDITSEAIYAFCSNLPNLKYLGLHDNISKDKLKTLFTRIPQLEYYH